MCSPQSERDLCAFSPIGGGGGGGVPQLISNSSSKDMARCSPSVPLPIRPMSCCFSISDLVSVRVVMFSSFREPVRCYMYTIFYATCLIVTTELEDTG